MRIRERCGQTLDQATVYEQYMNGWRVVVPLCLVLESDFVNYKYIFTYNNTKCSNGVFEI